MTSPEQQDPGPQFDVVLGIEPKLVLGLILVEDGRRRWYRLVIVRAKSIQRRCHAKLLPKVREYPLVIDAEQKGVPEGTGRECRLSLVIERDGVEI